MARCGKCGTAYSGGRCGPCVDRAGAAKMLAEHKARWAAKKAARNGGKR